MYLHRSASLLAVLGILLHAIAFAWHAGPAGGGAPAGASGGREVTVLVPICHKGGKTEQVAIKLPASSEGSEDGSGRAPTGGLPCTICASVCTAVAISAAYIVAALPCLDADTTPPTPLEVPAVATFDATRPYARGPPALS